MSSYAVSGIAAKRDTTESAMMEGVVSSEYTAEQQSYLLSLGELVEFLDEGLGQDSWWVVGGLSRDAHLGKKDFTVKYQDGGLRDVDILVREDKKRLYYHELAPLYQGPLRLAGESLGTNIQIGDNRVDLRFGKILVGVPPETFNTEVLSVGDVKFPSVPLNTLFHLYAVGDRPFGKMRQKDFLNALLIGRFMMENPNDKYPESMYEGFHEFAYRKNQLREDQFMLCLRGLAHAYSISPLNKILPMSDSTTRKALIHLWSMLTEIRS